MIRNPGSKYYVPYAEYADKYWPRGCNGGFYITKVDTIAKVWNQAYDEPMLRMDDIWITGILRQKSGIPDTCVVGAYFKADLHTSGFSGKDPDSAGFMKNEWQKLSAEINKRPHCICRK